MDASEDKFNIDFLRTLTLLYVEDDEEVREQLSRYLRRYCRELLVATDGQDGLEKFAASEPDVVVTDVRMPHVDGLEMARRIKEQRKNVPVIVVSAFSDTSYLLRAIEIGIDTYVKKPVETDRLLRAIHNTAWVAHQQRELAKAQREIRDSEEKFRKITSSAQDAILMVDDAARITYWNAAAERIFCVPSRDAIGLDVHGLISSKAFFAPLETNCAGDTDCESASGRTIQVDAVRSDGSRFPAELSGSVLTLDGRRYVMAILRDVTDRKRAEEALRRLADELEARVELRTRELSDANLQLRRDQEELRSLVTRLEQAHNQLLQAEKMASIGQLAAGVAHEINNPIGYINSNLNTLTGYIDALLRILAQYERCEANLGEASDNGSRQLILADIRSLKEDVDLQYLREDARNLVKESVDGIMRVKEIVQSLKDFAHVDEGQMQRSDLLQGLESTLKLVWNEVKYKADVIKEYGQIPEVECNPSQINQVFMNLLINAAQAIEGKGVITLRAGTELGMVWIDVIDNGCGIPAENLTRLFDPFFTTKPVGKGTGLGLSISYGIVKQHKGRIDVDSEPGAGARFRVWLPVRQ